MEEDRVGLQRFRLNNIQSYILGLLTAMLFVAINGPIPATQLFLWLFLPILFGILGFKLLGDVLWRQM